MTSPAAERGQEVRERLLAAAVELIPERGWPAVSTRVLAERAGVTPSVVHYHFSSMPALLNEAAIGRMREVLSEMDNAFDAAADPAAAIEEILASLDQYSGNDRTSLLFIEAYLAATRDEELRERIAGVAGEFRQRFGQWLSERGVPAAEETAAVLMASVDGLLLHRGLGSVPRTAEVAAVLRRLTADAKEPG
ncbi:TetR/AcrR family transcriptional regulator [Amycolatopsis sp. 195334CR]|uniref:TetR/AcrR family transcriptional regulator n=1 Tax=Amycolatopsis sp. 195334CR TaxID=2814588 RepID=UPI001A8E7E4D|nr:TetR/AcrR family transcriptional regulator [Amycolatopsis sp. 195334CR]MBN6038534.1 TetR/AcrR family transcriptional regulator [Amycolatopsis sp. 195334CR]